MKSTFNKLLVGLIGLGAIAVVMVLSNPSRETYLEFISGKLAADAQTDTCKSQDADTSSMPNGLKGLMKSACETGLTAMQSAIRSTIGNTTTRQDWTVLSIYTTEVPEKLPTISLKDNQLNIKTPTRKYTTIAAFGHFYTL
jgi:hypothetical protein